MKIAVAIPAFNEEKNIAGIILKLKKFTDEIIVCDDGSTDLTSEIADALGVKIVKHSKNLGYGSAIKSSVNFFNFKMVPAMFFSSLNAGIATAIFIR